VDRKINALPANNLKHPTSWLEPSSISIIIVNYNAGTFLTACVGTALAHADEIIVVDNASSDSSLALCIHSFPNQAKLKIIRHAVNAGFATACNIGMAQAHGDTLFFLNPDCQLSADAVEQMQSVLQSGPSIGMVGGLLTYPNGTEQGGGRRAMPTPWRAFVRAFGLYRLAPYFPKLFFDFHLHTQALPLVPIEVEAISGACMLVKRQAVDQVGPWDEGYFLHCEDLDWCMRFQQKGYRILFVPTAHIIHAQGACGQSRPIFVAWHKHKGMMRFYKKFYRTHYSFVVMWIIACGIALRFGLVVLYHTLRHIIRLLKINHA